MHVLRMYWWPLSSLSCTNSHTSRSNGFFFCSLAMDFHSLKCILLCSDEHNKHCLIAYNHRRLSLFAKTYMEPEIQILYVLVAVANAERNGPK